MLSATCPNAKIVYRQNMQELSINRERTLMCFYAVIICVSLFPDQRMNHVYGLSINREELYLGYNGLRWDQ